MIQLHYSFDRSSDARDCQVFQIKIKEEPGTVIFSEPQLLKQYLSTFIADIEFVTTDPINEVILKEWIGEWEYEKVITYKQNRIDYKLEEGLTIFKEGIEKGLILSITEEDIKYVNDENTLCQFITNNGRLWKEGQRLRYTYIKKDKENNLDCYSLSMNNVHFVCTSYYTPLEELMTEVRNVFECFSIETITEKIDTTTKIGYPILNEQWSFKIERNGNREITEDTK